MTATYDAIGPRFWVTDGVAHMVAHHYVDGKVVRQAKVTICGLVQRKTPHEVASSNCQVCFDRMAFSDYISPETQETPPA